MVSSLSAAARFDTHVPTYVQMYVRTYAHEISKTESSHHTNPPAVSGGNPVSRYVRRRGQNEAA